MLYIKIPVQPQHSVHSSIIQGDSPVFLIVFFPNFHFFPLTVSFSSQQIPD